MASKVFYLPTRIVQGVGCLAQIGQMAANFGKRALLACGRKAMREAGILDRAAAELEKAGVAPVVYDKVDGEPALSIIEEGLALARAERCEMTIGLGGGSAIDVAKAVAGLFHLPGRVAEYHAGRKLERPGIPFLAIPTTAGTGAEVSNNAVLTDPVRGIKTSIRSEEWYARLALVDPELTLSVPPSITASAGGDALCQAIEAYVSTAAMPITDALCEDAIRRTGRSLVRACEMGSDIAARTDMLYGSLLAGMALANARLGAVHGMAHSLGYRYRIPHGVICALLLPHVMEYNMEYARPKYARIADLLGLDIAALSEEEAAECAITAVRGIVQRIHLLLRLSEFGVRCEEWPAIIAESISASSTKFNPRPFQEEDVRAILEMAT